MWHEMVIATLAILLILFHFRSAFVICVTLPLSVLFSFGLMWMLRHTGIVDVQANIMSLAGITISIGILVDQAIVMVENATHHLKGHFGDARVTGNTLELVLPALRTVGRPIFFCRAHHAAFVRAGVHALRPRREAVPSAGVHQELRAHRRGTHFRDGRAGADSRRSFAAGCAANRTTGSSAVSSRFTGQF